MAEKDTYDADKQLSKKLKGGVIMDVTSPEQAKICLLYTSPQDRQSSFAPKSVRKRPKDHQYVCQRNDDASDIGLSLIHI